MSKNQSLELQEISVGDFVELIFALKESESLQSGENSFSLQEILRFGHFRGWLEDDDERHPQKSLNRQTAARIVHQFLLIEKNLPDIPDITPATKLKDLYNCRVCTNHIAQVYLRGIIGGTDSVPHDCELFNHLELVSKKEALEIVEKIKSF